MHKTVHFLLHCMHPGYLLALMWRKTKASLTLWGSSVGHSVKSGVAKKFHNTEKFHIPYLDSRVHVIVDIIVFQHSMAIVIEVNPDLLNETTEETYKQNEEHVDGNCSRLSPHVGFSSIDMLAVCYRTCFPLCILFLLSTGVLPVVTHTPASVLLYTSFSSITPCPFSCCVTRSQTLYRSSLRPFCKNDQRSV